MLYLNRYNKLINFYRENIADGFVEKHHIIPKCIGGTDDASNLILLPARAHFIAHYLLHKAYPDNTSLAHAFAMMGVNNKHQRRNSKLYEKSKIARSIAMTGVPRPEWVKEKLRKPKSNKENYKKPKSLEHSKNISKSLFGKSKSNQHRENISKALSGRKNVEAENRKNYYIQLFIDSKLTRKEFYKTHEEISESTLKRYLKNL